MDLGLILPNPREHSLTHLHTHTHTRALTHHLQHLITRLQSSPSSIKNGAMSYISL